MNQTPVRVIYIVIFTEAVLALIGVTSLCLTLFYKNYADPSVLTAIIAITSALIGSFTSLLTNTRQASTQQTIVATPSTPDQAPSITVEPEKKD